jgi:hypothetical protein
MAIRINTLVVKNAYNAVQVTESANLSIGKANLYNVEIGINIIPNEKTTVTASDIIVLRSLDFTADTDPRLAALFIKQYPSVPNEEKMSYIEKFKEGAKRVGNFTLNSTSLLSNLITISSSPQVKEFLNKYLLS